MKKIVLAFFVLFCGALACFVSLNAPTKAVFAQDNPEFDAKAICLMEYNSDQVLLEKNADASVPVASIVKLMTILITIEQIEDGKLGLNDQVVASHNAAGMGGSQVFIEAGGSYTVDEMLKSVIVSSANDASVVLAETIAGSESKFVEMMNKRAGELNLNGTVFANSTGLPASQHSCARDIAKLLKAVTGHELYHKYSTIWMDKLTHKGGRDTELVNTNKLIRYFEGCDGGKTGSTNEAGYCLAATAKRGDMRLIGVVLGAKNSTTRFVAASGLLNFGFSNFENKKLIESGEILQTLEIKGGKTPLEAISKDDITVLGQKGDDESISTKIDITGSLKAPVIKGDKVGVVYMIKGGIVVGESDILAKDTVKHTKISDNIMKIIEKWQIAS
ncbi:MAG: D-alanyl-D-alanine carboxypeptidase [Christensenellaceae bacterium]|jgi:D-alanyl-D-alanine carboxypeptidase (penicillin-binding protein 5/6)|nr:D-alanyl-D-alanine carboxypeptidase [Christensenellaceae bacterium]